MDSTWCDFRFHFRIIDYTKNRFESKYANSLSLSNTLFNTSSLKIWEFHAKWGGYQPSSIPDFLYSSWLSHISSATQSWPITMLLDTAAYSSFVSDVKIVLLQRLYSICNNALMSILHLLLAYLFTLYAEIHCRFIFASHHLH